jgi:hypothetical protein
VKSNFELANELSVAAINVVKNVKLQNKILTNIKMLFESKNYDALPPSYNMDLVELGMLRKWHYETGEIITQHIKEAIIESQEKGETNRSIAQKLGIPTRHVSALIK